MDLTDQQIRREDLRAAVLNALYARRNGAHRLDTIATLFLRDTDARPYDVEVTLTDLERMHLVQSAFEHSHSSIKVFQITGEGITFKERGFK
jgi:hypothetical protein